MKYDYFCCCCCRLPTSSVSHLKCIFIHIFSFLDCSTRWIYLLKTCAIQRYFSTSLYNFLVYIFFIIIINDMCYFSLTVNGFISWICKRIQRLCTVSVKGARGSRGAVRRRGLETEQRKEKKLITICCERERERERKEKNTNGLKMSLLFFQEITSLSRFCYFRKRELFSGA